MGKGYVLGRCWKMAARVVYYFCTQDYFNVFRAAEMTLCARNVLFCAHKSFRVILCA